MTLSAQKNMSNLKNEVKDLQSELSQKTEKKQDLLKEKDVLYQQFGEKLTELGKLKREIIGARTKQQQLKQKRDKLNNECRILIQDVKKINEQKKKITDKNQLGNNSERILEAMKRLEIKVETEVLTLNQEKKIMHKITFLKKQLNSSEQAFLLFRQSRDLSKRIDKTKKEANEYHKQLKEAQKQYKKDLKQFLTISKQAGAIREKKEGIYKTLRTTGKEIFSKNRNLKGKLLQSRMIFQKKRQTTRQTEQNKTEQFLEKRVKEVEQKIKLGKKLTTRDIISFQGSKKI